MATHYVMQRDTGGWRTQVWTSFTLAVLASGAGVMQLPSLELDRAFLAIGFFFCLFATFAAAKTVRDNRDGQSGHPWLDHHGVGFICGGGVPYRVGLVAHEHRGMAKRLGGRQHDQAPGYFGDALASVLPQPADTPKYRQRRRKDQAGALA